MNKLPPIFYFKYEWLLLHNTFRLEQPKGAELSVDIAVHLKSSKRNSLEKFVLIAVTMKANDNDEEKWRHHS